MAWNSAAKLPLPKPSDPCRSISSKKTVGRSPTGLVNRMGAHGVLDGFPPRIDLAAMGFGLTAFAVLEIAQGRRAGVVAALAAIDEVCEAHATTGQGDLLVRLVAQSNADLQRVIDAVVAVPDVVRTSTSIALSTPVPPRVRPLLERLAQGDT